MVPYEKRLDADREWAFWQGSLHFENESAVHHTLRKIAEGLRARGIAYAVAGAMAMFFHGFRRFTEDVNLLVSSEGLARIHERANELGFVRWPEESRNLRDLVSGVRVEFLVSHELPRNAKAPCVPFPEVERCAIRLQNLWVVGLAPLVEIKLSLGNSHPALLKHVADVQEMIRILRLPVEIAEQLDPLVRAKYMELWQINEQFHGVDE